MKHRHHLIPKRLGGDDSEENLTPPISLKLHAEFHRLLWEDFGQRADFIAWKVLSGQTTTREARSKWTKDIWADPIKSVKMRAVVRTGPNPGVRQAMTDAWKDSDRRPVLLESLVKARNARIQKIGGPRLKRIFERHWWHTPEGLNYKAVEPRDANDLPGCIHGVVRQVKTKRSHSELILAQYANPVLRDRLVYNSAKARLIPHEYQGITYESKKALQRMCELNIYQFYKLLNNGEIRRLPKVKGKIVK